MESIQKRNYSKWRAISLSAVYLLFGIHIAHWKLAGRTLAPLELNEVLYTLHLGIITAGFLFMGVAMIATVVAGRFFCSWMCHILALQDGSAWLLNKIGIRPVQIRSRTLLWIPVISMLYLFVLPQAERIFHGQPTVRLKVLNDAQGWGSFMTTDYWRNLPGAGITILTFLMCGFFIVYFLGSRSYCQYACPYGTLFALADRASLGRINLIGHCNQCGICTTSCQSHIQVHREIQSFGMVVNSDCLKDLDCIQSCPHGALSYGFKKPAGLKSLATLTREKKVYDFSVLEDCLFAVASLAFIIIFRGLYDTVPFLLAIVVSIIFSWLVVVFVRLFKRDFVRVNNVILKRQDRITSNGNFFLLAFVMLLVFSLHSAFVHYHAYVGDRIYTKLIFQERDGRFSSSSETNTNLNKALHHLSMASEWGLWTPASMNRQLAAIYMNQDENVKAKTHLEKLIDEIPGDLEARIQYSRLLFDLGDESRSVKNLQEIIATKNILTEHDKRISSEAHLMLGRYKEKNNIPAEAEVHYRKSLVDNTDNHEALLSLGILLARSGKLEEADTCLLKSSRYYTASALVENFLSVLYIRQHKYQDALIHLDKWLKIEPENEQACYSRAMILYELGNTPEAIETLKIMLHLNPANREANSAMSMMMHERHSEF